MLSLRPARQPPRDLRSSSACRRYQTVASMSAPRKTQRRDGILPQIRTPSRPRSSNEKESLSQQNADYGEIHWISDKAIRTLGNENHWWIPDGWRSPSKKHETPQATGIEGSTRSHQNQTQKAKGAVKSLGTRCARINHGVHTVALPGMTRVKSRDRSPTVMADQIRPAENFLGSFSSLTRRVALREIDYMAWRETESQVCCFQNCVLPNEQPLCCNLRG